MTQRRDASDPDETTPRDVLELRGLQYMLKQLRKAVDEARNAQERALRTRDRLAEQQKRLR